MTEVVRRDLALRYQLVGLVPHLRRFARGFVIDPENADDLVREACERALEKLNRSRKKLRLENLLYQIMHHRWIEKYRHSKTRSANLIVLSDKNKHRAAEPHTGGRPDVVPDVQSALSRLDDEQRAAIILICVEGYSYAEAAAVLELPAGTVASHVARARAKLGEWLFERHEDSLELNRYEQIEEKK